jgi:tetratricopeptide (TPR) repeat protein
VSLTAAALVLLQLGSSWASGRPAECTSLDGPSGANVWERAKAPELRKYCDKLALASARLSGGGSQPKEALALAEEADKLLPNRATPLVLQGRALVRLGRHADAKALFVSARQRDDHALDESAALLAWARTASRTGDVDEAAKAYGRLLPQSSTLPGAERSAAALEAGLLLLSRGPKSIDDAIAVLRQARREAEGAHVGASVLALALALDRAGQRDEARGVLGERAKIDPRPIVSDPRVQEVLANAAAALEADALVAVGLEATDAVAARDAFRRYAEKSKGPWVEHATARAKPGGAAPDGRPRPKGAR